MERTKVRIILESDYLTPMQIIDSVFEKLALKKGDWVLPLPLRYDPLIEITEYSAQDWKGRSSSESETKT